MLKIDQTKKGSGKPGLFNSLARKHLASDAANIWPFLSPEFTTAWT